MDWTFGTFLWSMLLFFFWFTVVWMFISLFADVLRRDDLSGWGKAGWVVLLVVLPYIGVFAYLIARGHTMGERAAREVGVGGRERRPSGTGVGGGLGGHVSGHARAPGWVVSEVEVGRVTVGFGAPTRALKASRSSPNRVR